MYKQTGKRSLIPNAKPFVKGDPRIRPGPGRPPRTWKEELARHEGRAIGTLLKAMELTRRKNLRYPYIAVRAAEDILANLHGKPMQPTREEPAIDLGKLSLKERETLDELLGRVLVRGNGQKADA